VAIQWKNGKLQSAAIHGAVPAMLKVCCGAGTAKVFVKAGQTVRPNADLQAAPGADAAAAEKDSTGKQQ
jgi:hypothetical protein